MSDRLAELQDRLGSAIEEGATDLEFTPAGRRRSTSTSSSSSASSDASADASAPETDVGEPPVDVLDPDDLIPLLRFGDEYVSAKFDVSTADEDAIEDIAESLVLVLRKYGAEVVGRYSPEITLLVTVAVVVLGKVAEYKIANSGENEIGEIKPEIVEDMET